MSLSTWLPLYDIALLVPVSAVATSPSVKCPFRVFRRVKAAQAALTPSFIETFSVASVFVEALTAMTTTKAERRYCSAQPYCRSRKVATTL